MRKNNLKITILALVNLGVCLSLLLTIVPAKVPFFTDLDGNILVLGSKYFLLIGIILPLIFAALFVFINNSAVKHIMAELIILFVYENMLGFSYFCTEPNFVLGSKTAISSSLSVFLPIALLVFFYGVKLKTMPYKHKLGVYSKHTTTTEFIWKQSHFSASTSHMLVGLLMFIVSIIFALFNLTVVEIIIFVVLFILARIYTISQGKFMSKKYNEMNDRKLQQEKLKELEEEINKKKS